MRHYIGFTSGGPTTLRNVRLDATGEPLLLVDQDAVTKILLDWRDWLETGETISSVTITAEGCTATVATSTPTATLTISAVTSYTDGKITVIATSSTGEKWRGIIRVRRANRYTDEQRFRDYV